MSLMVRRVSVPLVPLVVGLVVLAVLAVVIWVRDADVRRVEAVCETWLDHRSALDAVVEGTAVAIERLDDPGDRRPESLARAYDDVGRHLAALETWISVVPGLRDDIGDWHVDASRALKHSLSNSRQLLATIRTGAADEAAGNEADLAAENLEATQEWLRDTCGAAWRA